VAQSEWQPLFPFGSRHLLVKADGIIDEASDDLEHQLGFLAAIIVGRAGAGIRVFL
jgi:hypothetical protein